jgi:hypothetical protein
MTKALLDHKNNFLTLVLISNTSGYFIFRLTVRIDVIEARRTVSLVLNISLLISGFVVRKFSRFLRRSH